MRSLHYFFFIVCLLFTSCQELSGKYELGNNLVLLDNDVKEEKIIVFCNADCNGGVYVVPSYQNHYDTLGRYAEYVENVELDGRWVWVKSWRIQEQSHRYYIIDKSFNLDTVNCMYIDCDSIIQLYVFGPYTLDEFESKREILNLGVDY